MSFFSLRALLEPPDDSDFASKTVVEQKQVDVKLKEEVESEPTRYQVLEAKRKLDADETIELVTMAITVGKQQIVQSLLSLGKLQLSEELGDLIVQFDTSLAISVYYKVGLHDKVIITLSQRGDIEKIVAGSFMRIVVPDCLFCLLQCSVDTKKLIIRHFWEDMRRIESLFTQAFQTKDIPGDSFALLLRLLIDGRRGNLEKLCTIGN
jgi:hypothetical protein